jgi:hypothetical protein
MAKNESSNLLWNDGFQLGKTFVLEGTRGVGRSRIGTYYLLVPISTPNTFQHPTQRTYRVS